MILQVPTGETLVFGDDNFIKFEEVGVQEARKAAFVLVAGGLGERLGYSGIKVHLVTLYNCCICCDIIMCNGISCVYIEVPEKLASMAGNFFLDFRVIDPISNVLETGFCWLSC